MNDTHAGSGEINATAGPEVKSDRLVLTVRQNRNYSYKVDKSPHPKGCWLWTGKPDEDGYGTFRVGKKCHQSHRVSFMVFKGIIPMGMLVCHACDNPPCVNPEHLWLGTALDNNHDAFHKGRSKLLYQSGESNPSAILSDESVRRIRAEYAKGLKEQAELALMYNVSQGAISRIITGRSWKHVK